MATPTQQAMAALQQELELSRNQVLALTRRVDELSNKHGDLTAAHNHLHSESDRLFKQRHDEISALEAKLSATLFRQNFDLLDLKSMKPEKFSGAKNEAWKPWARRFRAYCNGKAQGFRSALEWSEAQPTEITSFAGCPWDKASRQQFYSWREGVQPTHS